MYYKSLKDHVYDYISKSITSGKLKPNEKINEKEICEDLSVSGTPVREALIHLETYGYIERIPRKGFYVKELSLEKVKEKYIVIGALDGLSASLSLDYITKKDLKKMEKIIEEIDLSVEERNYQKYFKLQISFHKIYTDKCKNKELISTIDRLKKSFIRKTYIPDGKEDDLYETLHITNLEHKEILKLFIKGNKKDLEDYIRNSHWSPKYAEHDAFIFDHE